MLDSSQLIVKLLARLLLPSDLAVCTCHCAKRTPNFVISNTGKHVSLLPGRRLRSFNFILTNPILLKSRSHSAPSHQGIIITTQLWTLPIASPRHVGTNLQISAARIADDYHWEDLVPSSLSGGEPRTRPSGRHQVPTATYRGQAGRRSNCSSGHLPRAPWSQPSSGSNGHHHRQQGEYFSSHWIHSVTGLSLKSIRLLPCYFITGAPWAEVILVPHFFPSNNRFHSCLQRSWFVCLILAMLTHPARVPWSV